MSNVKVLQTGLFSSHLFEIYPFAKTGGSPVRVLMILCPLQTEHCSSVAQVVCALGGTVPMPLQIGQTCQAGLVETCQVGGSTVIRSRDR